MRLIDKTLELLDNISPQARRRAAVIMLLATLILWPLTQLTIARNEPPFILGLSWFAITMTSIDVVATTDVRAEKDDEES